MCISADYKIYATSKKRHKPTFIHILHTPVSNFSTKKWRACHHPRDTPAVILGGSRYMLSVQAPCAPFRLR